MFVNISTIADISSTTTYKLISSSSYWPLAVDPDQPDLQLRAKTRNDTPLEFQFRASDEVGKFNVCAAVENATYCLDVFNDPKDLPHLSPWNYYSGQYWTIETSSDGVRLSNDWTGPDWFLGVNQSSLQTHMSTGNDYPGQFWMLDQVATNVTLPPDAPDVDGPITLSSDDGGSGGQLSIPAIIAISLAGGIFLASSILITLILVFRRRCRRLGYIRQQDAAIAAGGSPSNDGNHVIRSPSSSTTLDPSSNLIPVPDGPTSPEQAHLNNIPVELEAPMAMCPADSSPQLNAQRHSIYELPASPINHPHHPNPEEKDPYFFNTATTSTTTNTLWPASLPSQNTHRNHAIARWEEVVPDGNVEITFNPTLTHSTTTTSSSPPGTVKSPP